MNKSLWIKVSANVIVVLVLVVVVFFNKTTAIAKVNDVTYLKEEENIIMPVVDDEQKLESKKLVSEVDNSNIEIVDSKTLLDYETEEDPIEYINENQEELVKGVELKVDDKVFYVENKEIINEAASLLNTLFIRDEEVLKNYYNTKTLKGYKYEGKNISSIKLENDMSYRDSYVPKSQVIGNSQDLLYLLFHKDSTLGEREMYTVEDGQSFNQVLKATKMEPYEFFVNNPQYIATPLLKEGDKIIVNKINPLLKVAVSYTEEVEEKLDFDVIRKKTTTLDAGEQEVSQKGKQGLEKVTYKTKVVNGKVVEKQSISREVLKNPVNKIILVGKNSSTNSDGTGGDTTSSNQSAGIGGFIWPMDSRSVTCGYGCYSGHVGIDIQGGYGASIYAAKSGTVVQSGWDNYGAGYAVTIDHGGGIYTNYFHMKQQPNVSVGESVSQGQVIGYEGATGNVTGPHLHFEIRLGAGGGFAYSGSTVDPYGYL